MIPRSLPLALSLLTLSASAAPSLQIHLVQGRMELGWSTTAGHAYAVESASTVTGPWDTRQRLDAAGASLTWTEGTLTPTEARFYRIADLGPTPTGRLTTEQAFRAVETVPVDLSDYFTRSSQQATDAVQAATQLSQSAQPVTHGTLTLTGVSADPVHYSPQPADRLVIVPVTGGPTEIRVLQLDVTRAIYEWRQTSAEGDLTLRSSPANAATQLTAKGTFRSVTFPGVEFTVDLTAIVSGFSEVDSSGSHTLSDVRVTGHLDSLDFSQEVDGRNRFEFVSARNSVGRLESASTGEVWSNHRLTTPAGIYVWVNAKRQRSFRDGKESDIDTYWNAFGTVTFNGADYGTLRKLLTPVGNSVIDLRFQLVTPGTTLDIEHWTVQAP